MKTWIILFTCLFGKICWGCNFDVLSKINFVRSTEEFENFTISFIHISENSLRSRSFGSSRRIAEVISPTSLTNDPNVIYVGFNSNGHVYLASSKYRFDGDLFWQKTNLNSKDPQLEEGIVFALRDSGGVLKQRFEAIISDRRSLSRASCASSACEVLFSSSIQDLNNQRVHYIRPSQIFIHMLSENLQLNSGEMVQVTPLVIGNHNFQNSYDIMISREGDFITRNVVAAAAVFTLPVYALFLTLFQSI